MENKPARTISIQLKEIIQPYVTALLKQLGVTINNWVTLRPSLYATCPSLKIRSEVAHYNCTIVLNTRLVKCHRQVMTFAKYLYFKAHYYMIDH